MSYLSIRTASLADAQEILRIYAPYVKDTAISFEYEVPTLEEFTGRMERTLQKYPYIVAIADGEILGYAYTSPFVGRRAYDWAAETTIYVKRDKRRKGVGRKLYQAIEDISQKQHIINLNACIGYKDVEDEHLTKDSVNFHAHLGYRLVGRFHKCGYKFGRWYDMVWMEKILAPHPERPEAVIPFPELHF